MQNCTSTITEKLLNLRLTFNLTRFIHEMVRGVKFKREDERGLPDQILITFLKNRVSYQSSITLLIHSDFSSRFPSSLGVKHWFPAGAYRSTDLPILLYLPVPLAIKAGMLDLLRKCASSPACNSGTK